MNEIEFLHERLERGEITCEVVITFLLEYLEHELPPAREREFERHLARCPSCVAYLSSYRETIELARAARRDDEPLPRELAVAILASRR